MISKSLIKSSLIYTVIGALPLISGFLLLLFYTNYISTEAYGEFVLFVAFTGIIQVMVNFGTDAYIGVTYFENRHDSGLLRQKLGIATGFLMLWGLFVVLALTLVGENLFDVLFRKNRLSFFPFGFMSVLTAFFNSYFKTYSNLLINLEKPERFAWVNMANFVMTIAFSLAGLFLYPNTLIGPMWGRLLSGVGIFLIAVFSFRRISDFTLRLAGELKGIIRFALPVLIFVIIGWSLSNIYPFILNNYLSLTDVAIFGLALQFTLLLEFVFNGLSSSVSPKMYALIHDKGLRSSTPEYNKYFSGFNMVALLVIPAATFFIPLILPLLISKDYEASFVFLAILNIAFATRGVYHYFITPVYILRKTSVLPFAFGLTAVVQIIASVIGIRYAGLWGAAGAFLFTKIVQLVFLYAGASRFFRFSFNRAKFIGLPMLVTLVVVISEFYLNRGNLHLIRFFQLVFTYGMVFLFYRREIFPTLKQLAAGFWVRKKDPV